MIPGPTVATYNVYLGADLLPLLAAAGDPVALAHAADRVRDELAASRPAERIARVADLLARQAPDVVGLQEAVTLRTPWGGHDLVAVLLERLAALGCPFVLAQRREAFTGGGAGVRLTGHDVLLVRDRPGLDVVATASGSFSANLPLPPADGEALVEATLHRGWVAADLRTAGGVVRVVSTHLEAHDAAVNQAQARELSAAVPAGSSGGVVLVGDLNARPGRDGAAVLTGAGFRDAWDLAGRDGDRPPGFTCGQDADLRNATSRLDHRIDYVLVGPGVGVASVRTFGDDPDDRLAPDVDGNRLWPSDHAGVLAVLTSG